MISWMQKHKKYLVVTIWISTIAFVAAGMIGWGQYNFSLASGGVAKVGQISITQEELAREHKQLLDIYSQSIPNFKDLSEKEIKALGIERSALNILINQALLKNLALDLGLGVSDSEVVAEIQKSELFQKDGHFDEGLYKKLLQENHYRPSAFEDSVKSTLLLKKISALFPQALTPLEQEAFMWPLKLQDRVRIEVLEPQEIPLKEESLKAYYDQHKQDYKKPTSYTLESLQISVKDNPKESVLNDYYNKHKDRYTLQGKPQEFSKVLKQVRQDYNQETAKEQALQKYLALKKGQIKPESATFTSLPYSEDINQKIKSMRVGEVLKPLPYNEGWVVLKLVAKDTNALESFKEARVKIAQILQTEAQIKELKKEALQKLPNFKGSDIGLLNLDFKGNIHDLGEKPSKELVSYIFKHPYKEGFTLLEGPKAVLYKVYAQDFKHAISNADYLKQMAQNLKAQALDGALVAMLKQRYKVSLYAK
ncbi:peptidylprolyl isomerase [Helicobacter ailurogastricus]|uniref:peptidylprolyl isomerase n=1 Tax=Helicobacter ailurogastricus TaxID=1578720 RepID=UPI00244D91F4|nr:peptidylprolyl isomerase [Helicobacter ailurogastricus]GMB91742.1 Peptidyl-prolyl cis-trans isomerase D PpiD [Helicobacter ailurogastricus]